MQDFSKAQVGEKLWSAMHGDVVVKAVDNTSITVAWKNGCRASSFTIDGRWDSDYAVPQLFWSRPTFEFPAPPKRITKRVGYVCLVHGDRHGMSNVARRCSHVFDNKAQADDWCANDGLIRSTIQVAWEEQE
jgi:hypothetical protein